MPARTGRGCSCQQRHTTRRFRASLCGPEYRNVCLQQRLAGRLVEGWGTGHIETRRVRYRHTRLGRDAWQHMVLGWPRLEQRIQHGSAAKRSSGGLRCPRPWLVCRPQPPFRRGQCRVVRWFREIHHQHGRSNCVARHGNAPGWRNRVHQLNRVQRSL